MKVDSTDPLSLKNKPIKQTPHTIRTFHHPSRTVSARRVKDSWVCIRIIITISFQPGWGVDSRLQQELEHLQFACRTCSHQWGVTLPCPQVVIKLRLEKSYPHNKLWVTWMNHCEKKEKKGANLHSSTSTFLFCLTFFYLKVIPWHVIFNSIICNW